MYDNISKNVKNNIDISYNIVEIKIKNILQLLKICVTMYMKLGLDINPGPPTAGMFPAIFLLIQRKSNERIKYFC